MDYDATDIPAAYDRGRDHGPVVLDLWMKTLDPYLGHQSISVVLDLGCGTGRFSEGLARHFDAGVIGVDPSEKMLTRAVTKRKDSRVRYVRGRAEEIPLADASVHVIFMSMIFHHFADPSLAVGECRRVLRDGGTVFLRAGTVERVSDYPQVNFFPTSRSLTEALLPTTTKIRETFRGAGFHTIAATLVTQQVAPSHAVFAEKVSTRADSVLASLSREDFEAGLQALRMQSTQVDPLPVCEPIDFFVFQ